MTADHRARWLLDHLKGYTPPAIEHQLKDVEVIKHALQIAKAYGERCGWDASAGGEDEEQGAGF